MARASFLDGEGLLSKPVAWAKRNLFSSPANIAFTLLGLWLLGAILPPFPAY